MGCGPRELGDRKQKLGTRRYTVVRTKPGSKSRRKLPPLFALLLLLCVCGALKAWCPCCSYMHSFFQKAAKNGGSRGADDPLTHCSSLSFSWLTLKLILTSVPRGEMHSSVPPALGARGLLILFPLPHFSAENPLSPVVVGSTYTK